MSRSLNRLKDPSTLIVLAYAPAGLGHLRVTKALYQGLPPGTKATLLPDTASSVKSIHQFTSITPWAKKILEWSQYGIQEDVITTIYRSMLQQDTHVLKHRLLSLLKEQITPPKKLLVVATHFGIAHQIASIKHEIESKGGVKIFLIVQVTDDSPQKLWYIPNADMISVPSDQTRMSLLAYAKQKKLKPSRIITIPYPISPTLVQKLNTDEQMNKLRQADPSAHALIHVSLPVSGAGVGLSYASELMTETHRLEPRIRFHITAKRTLLTRRYLASWERRDYITVFESHSDRQIVELYQQVYSEVPILLEITKPSEQAFKALLHPNDRGGSILLFTHPVGRQEYDNLSFLQRHSLIPAELEEKQLCDVLNLTQKSSIVLPLSTWRGFCLPDDPKQAAQWISRGLSLRIFLSMLKQKKQETDEISSAGVQTFWEKVGGII